MGGLTYLGQASQCEGCRSVCGAGSLLCPTLQARCPPAGPPPPPTPPTRTHTHLSTQSTPSTAVLGVRLKTLVQCVPPPANTPPAHRCLSLGHHACRFECKSDGQYLEVLHASLEPADGEVEDSAYTGPVSRAPLLTSSPLSAPPPPTHERARAHTHTGLPCLPAPALLFVGRSVHGPVLQTLGHPCCRALARFGGLSGALSTLTAGASSQGARSPAGPAGL